MNIKFKIAQVKRLIANTLCKLNYYHQNDICTVLQDVLYDYRCQLAINENVRKEYHSICTALYVELANADLFDEEHETIEYLRAKAEIVKSEHNEILDKIAQMYRIDR